MTDVQIKVGSRVEYMQIDGVNCMVVEGVDGNRYASRLHLEPIQGIKDNCKASKREIVAAWGCQSATSL